MCIMCILCVYRVCCVGYALIITYLKCFVKCDDFQGVKKRGLLLNHIRNCVRACVCCLLLKQGQVYLSQNIPHPPPTLDLL